MKCSPKKHFCEKKVGLEKHMVLSLKTYDSNGKRLHTNLNCWEVGSNL